MELLLLFFPLVSLSPIATFLFLGAASMQRHAYFNETGELPCYFTNPENISLDELVVFWQNQDKLVLYELFKGKENSQNVHSNYKDRTSLDQDNWTLRLHNVQIKDKGLYHCFIHHRNKLLGMIPIHQKIIDLSVLGMLSIACPDLWPFRGDCNDQGNTGWEAGLAYREKAEDSHFWEVHLEIMQGLGAGN